MLALDICLLGLAILGHLAVTVVYANYCHTIPIRKLWTNLLTRLGQAVFLAIVGSIAWWCYRHGPAIVTREPATDVPLGLWAYLAVFAPVGAIPFPLWLYRRLTRRTTAKLRRQSSRRHDVAARLGRAPIASGGLASMIARLPGNECFSIDVAEKEIELPRLPEALDGLTISHLSDLHVYPGHIERAYFEAAVELSNAMRPDLVAVTGDLIDSKECIPWVAEVLGKLESRLGAYVIFGNHDWLVRELPALCQAVTAAGLTYVGGRWHEVDVDGQTVYLAGNELPWIKPAAPLEAGSPASRPEGGLAIALVHTPDQYPWAKAGDFDLMLSGHTHGGQVAFPWLGPVFAAARTGVRYVSGVFYEPPTVLHVSRGLSGMAPLRYGCPPELVKLTLRCPAECSSRRDRAAADTLAVGG